MYRKRVQDGLYGDTKEMIEQCLNCGRKECNNCFDRATPTFKYNDTDMLSENEKKYELILSDTEVKLLDYYCTLPSDRAIAGALGVAESTVRNIRFKLRLPIMRKHTEEERKDIVMPWRRPSVEAV